MAQYDRANLDHSLAASQQEQQPKAKKPYVRIMTEKRREQNRRAQKVYREKQKKRLEALEDRNESTGDEEPTATVQSDEEIQCPMTSYTSEAGTSRLEAGSRDDPAPGATIIDFNIIFQSNGDIPISSEGILTDFMPLLPTPSPPTFTATLPQHSSASSRGKQPSGPDYKDNYWPMPPTDPSEPYMPPPADSTASYTPYMAGSLPIMSRPYAYHRQLRLLDAHDSQNSASSSASTSAAAAASLPSPYLNTLRLTSESSLSASLSIALSLGISRNHYLEDHPSPFVPCFAKLANAPQPVVSGILAKHASGIAPTLRPHLIQYTHPHPSYLDCIVFPRLRARAVSASVAGTLDHVEFFLDLMHGGLVCWGGGTPATSRNTRGGARGRRVAASGGSGSGAGAGAGMGSDVAWSARSWEARRWFLEKWAWLAGSEEEEQTQGDGMGVWECSRWWWGVRGEEWFGGDEGGEEGEWAEGWIQGPGDGARRFEGLEAAKAEYTPMSGRENTQGVL